MKKPSQQADLARQLTQIGLSHYEAQTYVGLLRRGLTVAGALAKHLGMKRSTVYTALDSLMEKGLIALTIHEGVKHYQAEGTKRLADFLAQKKQAINQQEELLAALTPELNDLSAREEVSPQITIYEGKKGVLNLLLKTLDEHPKEILVIGQHNPEKDHIPEFTQKRIELGIPTRVFASDSKWLRSEIKKDKASFRKTYPIKGYKLPSSIHIYDHSVILFTYAGNEPVGVHIENDDIASTLQMVFHMLEKKR